MCYKINQGRKAAVFVNKGSEKESTGESRCFFFVRGQPPGLFIPKFREGSKPVPGAKRPGILKGEQIQK